jgi:hypothetical protein
MPFPENNEYKWPRDPVWWTFAVIIALVYWAGDVPQKIYHTFHP